MKRIKIIIIMDLQCGKLIANLLTVFVHHDAFSNATSLMGSNLSFLRSKYGINFQSHSLAHGIKVTTTVEQLDSLSY